MKNNTASEMVIGQKVEGGTPYTVQYDEGEIVAINGQVAEVAWQSGVRTYADLRRLRVGHSGRFPVDSED